MRINFTKMHGLGNDFVVLDAISQTIELTPSQVRQLADRHFGVGCDQVLLVERPRDPDTDFYYRIFNADGGEVGQCGNGARCFARFVREKGLSDKPVLDVGTAAGNIRLYHEPHDRVRVNMGPPVFEPASIPFLADREALSYQLEMEDRVLPIAALSMGNPHAVLRVDDVARAPVLSLGPLIEKHPAFPERVNVGFMTVIDPTRIDLRVFERGAGETLACGTGACAAVVAGRRWGLLDETVQVRLPGGELMISWTGDSGPVWLSGPATTVFEGVVTL
jgi:diaminopimelate epimerase